MLQDVTAVSALRVLVAYLGEQAPAWWSSQFFSPNAAAFLGPVFARTLFQAQCQGATAAAARLHDEHIGVGRAFHLFRMPEGIEQAIATTLVDSTFEAEIRPYLTSREQALQRLSELAEKASASDGPVALGELSEDFGQKIKVIAGLYHDAFSKGIKTFPFLREA